MCKVASIRELIENLLPKEQGNKFYVQLLEINKQLIKKKKRHSKLNNKENQNIIILDSKFINVIKITSAENTELNYFIDTKNKLKESLGTPLIIKTERNLKKGEKYKINIIFETTEKSQAIQWIPKEGTKSKVEKFVYLQCEAILCRTFFPCQVMIFYII